MSKDLEVIKSDVKKLMLKDWTETEVAKLDEFMEDVIIATMQVNKLPIHNVVGQSEQLNYTKTNKLGQCLCCGDTDCCDDFCDG